MLSGGSCGMSRSMSKSGRHRLVNRPSCSIPSMCTKFFIAAIHALPQYKVTGYPYEAMVWRNRYEFRGRVHERVDAQMRTGADSNAVKDRAGVFDPGR